MRCELALAVSQARKLLLLRPQKLLTPLHAISLTLLQQLLAPSQLLFVQPACRGGSPFWLRSDTADVVLSSVAGRLRTVPSLSSSSSPTAGILEAIR